ncbi:tryptophan-rich sensory protein [Thiofilum flexile]|uniref:tryptophan-rich sensory protein n=1 Tax=Thiofilum flexile TaxID=125627 RepID=UPI00037CFA08|nr:tryptophan-rich sensory protein [Thiofilum flexile]
MKLTNTHLLWLNIATFILMILVNIAGSSGSFGVNVAEVSARYTTLLTPAGYAFSIWGLIYLLLIGFLAYQWKSHQQGDDAQSLEPASIWFALSNVLNALWIIAWVNHEIGLSALLILGLWGALFQLVVSLRLELWDAPVRIIFWVWWPICIYIGWITLALPLNIAVLLSTAFITPPLFSAETWAILALAAITSAYLLWTQYRNMREASLVAVWGFIAITVHQWQVSITVSLFALVCGALLLSTVVAHALRNQATLPIHKLQRGEY